VSKDCPCGLGCDGTCPKTEDEKRLALMKAWYAKQLSEDPSLDICWAIRLLDEEKRARTEAEATIQRMREVFAWEHDARMASEAALAEERAKREAAHNELCIIPFRRASETDETVCLDQHAWRRLLNVIDMLEGSGPSVLAELRKERDEHRGCAIALEARAETAEARVAELTDALRGLLGWAVGPTCSDCDPRWSCQTAVHEADCAAVVDINRAMLSLYGPGQAERVSEDRHAEARPRLKARVAELEARLAHCLEPGNCPARRGE
jgi:hypothetical protein